MLQSSSTTYLLGSASFVKHNAQLFKQFNILNLVNDDVNQLLFLQAHRRFSLSGVDLQSKHASV